MRNPPAFTLIELLVVLTIIVVLLALLTPALDKAVYQAELALCGTKLNAIGVGVQAYAVGYKRRYPYRPSVSVLAGERPITVAYNCNPVTGKQDDRPVLRLALGGLNASLVCPLAAKIDIEGSNPDTCSYSTYALWFDWRYRFPDERGMFHVGDRFTWRGDSFDILAGDWDQFFISSNNLEGNPHPDLDGVMALGKAQDEGALKSTYSFWGCNPIPDRGPVDNNYIYGDGSVRRFNAVLVKDPRMIRVPQTNNNSQVWEAHLPRL